MIEKKVKWKNKKSKKEEDIYRERESQFDGNEIL